MHGLPGGAAVQVQILLSNNSFPLTSSFLLSKSVLGRSSIFVASLWSRPPFRKFKRAQTRGLDKHEKKVRGLNENVLLVYLRNISLFTQYFILKNVQLWTDNKRKKFLIKFCEQNLKNNTHTKDTSFLLQRKARTA